MTEAQRARAQLIRKIVAEHLDRSFRGTDLGTRIRQLGLTEDDEREIAWRIGNEVGADLRDLDWSAFPTVGDLVFQVEVELERQQPGGAPV